MNENKQKKWAIFSHLFTLLLGFLLAILTGIGGHIAENIIIKIWPTMDISVQEFKITNYGHNIAPKGMEFALKLRIKNKKFPNTWEKMTIRVDGQEIIPWGSAKSPPIHFEPYETKEIMRDLYIEGKETRKNQAIEVEVCITDAFEKSISSKNNTIASE